jgi:hypothetical protein
MMGKKKTILTLPRRMTCRKLAEVLGVEVERRWPGFLHDKSLASPKINNASLYYSKE